MTTPSGQSGPGSFNENLKLIAATSANDEAAQSRLLLLMVREVHTIKWILWWVLIIVPAVAIVLGIILANAAASSVPSFTP